MKASSGLLLIGLGIIVLYIAVTNKYSCLVSFGNCIFSAQSLQSGATTSGNRFFGGGIGGILDRFPVPFPGGLPKLPLPDFNPLPDFGPIFLPISRPGGGGR